MTTPLPIPPHSSRSDVFEGESDVFLGALPTFQVEMDALGGSVAAMVVGGMAIPFTFSTTTTDSDPGIGAMRLSSATQNLSTVIRLDTTGGGGTDWSALIDNFSASTGAVKGQIRLVKLNDLSKWMVFNLTAVASPAGYRNLAVAHVASSAASPFANGDIVVLMFARAGDVGPQGPQGSLNRRVTSIASSATPTPSANTDDMYSITALAANATFGAPTGSPADGQGLMIRIKDNGAPRTLAFNVAYRAGTDSPLPGTTVINKTMYLGFVYNAPDAKWDLIAVLGNI